MNKFQYVSIYTPPPLQTPIQLWNILNSRRSGGIIWKFNIIHIQTTIFLELPTTHNQLVGVYNTFCQSKSADFICIWTPSSYNRKETVDTVSLLTKNFLTEALATVVEARWRSLRQGHPKAQRGSAMSVKRPIQIFFTTHTPRIRPAIESIAFQQRVGLCGPVIGTKGCCPLVDAFTTIILAYWSLLNRKV